MHGELHAVCPIQVHRCQVDVGACGEASVESVVQVVEDRFVRGGKEEGEDVREVVWGDAEDGEGEVRSGDEREESAH